MLSPLLYTSLLLFLPLSVFSECHSEDYEEKHDMCSRDPCYSNYDHPETLHCVTCRSDVSPACRTRGIDNYSDEECSGCFTFEYNGGVIVERGCIEYFPFYSPSDCFEYCRSLHSYGVTDCKATCCNESVCHFTTETNMTVELDQCTINCDGSKYQHRSCNNGHREMIYTTGVVSGCLECVNITVQATEFSQPMESRTCISPGDEFSCNEDFLEHEVCKSKNEDDLYHVVVDCGGVIYDSDDCPDCYAKNHSECKFSKDRHYFETMPYENVCFECDDCPPAQAIPKVFSRNKCGMGNYTCTHGPCMTIQYETDDHYNVTMRSAFHYAKQQNALAACDCADKDQLNAHFIRTVLPYASQASPQTLSVGCCHGLLCNSMEITDCQYDLTVYSCDVTHPKNDTIEKMHMFTHCVSFYVNGTEFLAGSRHTQCTEASFFRKFNAIAHSYGLSNVIKNVSCCEDGNCIDFNFPPSNNPCKTSKRECQNSSLQPIIDSFNDYLANSIQVDDDHCHANFSIPDVNTTCYVCKSYDEDSDCALGGRHLMNSAKLMHGCYKCGVFVRSDKDADSFYIERTCDGKAILDIRRSYDDCAVDVYNEIKDIDSSMINACECVDMNNAFAQHLLEKIYSACACSRYEDEKCHLHDPLWQKCLLESSCRKFKSNSDYSRSCIVESMLGIASKDGYCPKKMFMHSLLMGYGVPEHLYFEDDDEYQEEDYHSPDQKRNGDGSWLQLLQNLRHKHSFCSQYYQKLMHKVPRNESHNNDYRRKRSDHSQKDDNDENSCPHDDGDNDYLQEMKPTKFTLQGAVQILSGGVAGVRFSAERRALRNCADDWSTENFPICNSSYCGDCECNSQPAYSSNFDFSTKDTVACYVLDDYCKHKVYGCTECILFNVGDKQLPVCQRGAPVCNDIKRLEELTCEICDSSFNCTVEECSRKPLSNDKDPDDTTHILKVDPYECDMCGRFTPSMKDDEHELIKCCSANDSDTCMEEEDCDACYTLKLNNSGTITTMHGCYRTPNTMAAAKHYRGYTQFPLYGILKQLQIDADDFQCDRKSSLMMFNRMKWGEQDLTSLSFHCCEEPMCNVNDTSKSMESEKDFLTCLVTCNEINNDEFPQCCGVPYGQTVQVHGCRQCANATITHAAFAGASRIDHFCLMPEMPSCGRMHYSGETCEMCRRLGGSSCFLQCGEETFFTNPDLGCHSEKENHEEEGCSKAKFSNGVKELKETYPVLKKELDKLFNVGLLGNCQICAGCGCPSTDLFECHCLKINNRCQKKFFYQNALVSEEFVQDAITNRLPRLDRNSPKCPSSGNERELPSEIKQKLLCAPCSLEPHVNAFLKIIFLKFGSILDEMPNNEEILGHIGKIADECSDDYDSKDNRQHHFSATADFGDYYYDDEHMDMESDYDSSDHHSSSHRDSSSDDSSSDRGSSSDHSSSGRGSSSEHSSNKGSSSEHSSSNKGSSSEHSSSNKGSSSSRGSSSDYSSSHSENANFDFHNPCIKRGTYKDEPSDNDRNSDDDPLWPFFYKIVMHEYGYLLNELVCSNKKCNPDECFACPMGHYCDSEVKLCLPAYNKTVEKLEPSLGIMCLFDSKVAERLENAGNRIQLEHQGEGTCAELIEENKGQGQNQNDNNDNNQESTDESIKALDEKLSKSIPESTTPNCKAYDGTARSISVCTFTQMDCNDILQLNFATLLDLLPKVSSSARNYLEQIITLKCEGNLPGCSNAVEDSHPFLCETIENEMETSEDDRNRFISRCCGVPYEFNLAKLDNCKDKATFMKCAIARQDYSNYVERSYKRFSQDCQEVVKTWKESTFENNMTALDAKFVVKFAEYETTFATPELTWNDCKESDVVSDKCSTCWKKYLEGNPQGNFFSTCSKYVDCCRKYPPLTDVSIDIEDPSQCGLLVEILDEESNRRWSQVFAESQNKVSNFSNVLFDCLPDNKKLDRIEDPLEESVVSIAIAEIDSTFKNYKAVKVICNTIDVSLDLENSAASKLLTLCPQKCSLFSYKTPFIIGIIASMDTEIRMKAIRALQKPNLNAFDCATFTVSDFIPYLPRKYLRKCSASTFVAIDGCSVSFTLIDVGDMSLTKQFVRPIFQFIMANIDCSFFDWIEYLDPTFLVTSLPLFPPRLGKLCTTQHLSFVNSEFPQGCRSKFVRTCYKELKKNGDSIDYEEFSHLLNCISTKSEIDSLPISVLVQYVQRSDFMQISWKQFIDLRALARCEEELTADEYTAYFADNCNVICHQKNMALLPLNQLLVKMTDCNCCLTVTQRTDLIDRTSGQVSNAIETIDWLRLAASNGFSIWTFEMLPLAANCDKVLSMFAVSSTTVCSTGNDFIIQNALSIYTTCIAAQRRKRALGGSYTVESIVLYQSLMCQLLEVVDIQNFVDQDFKDALYEISRVICWTERQNEAYAAKLVSAYGGAANIPTTDLISAAGFASGFTPDDFSNLNIDDDVMDAYGDLNLSPDQFHELAQNYMSGNPTLDNSKLQLLNKTICGLTTSQISGIDDSEFGDYLAESGFVHQCETTILQAFATLAKSANALGPVADWDCAKVEQAGFIIAGISTSDIGSLSADGFYCINAEVFGVMSVELLRAVNDEQRATISEEDVVYMSNEQAEAAGVKDLKDSVTDDDEIDLAMTTSVNVALVFFVFVGTYFFF